MGWKATLGVQPQGSGLSIFLWQQNRGHGAVRFRDDPDLGSAVKGVSREQPKSVNETEFVLATVLLVQFAPVSCQMTL